MKRLLGPVLHAESQTDPDVWSFRLNLYLHGGTGAAPPLRLAFFERSAVGLRERQDVTVQGPTLAVDFSRLVDANYAGRSWSWRVSMPREAKGRVLTYRITSTDVATPFEPIEVPEVFIPARGQLPRAAFFSCNGTPNASKLTGHEPLALWDAMLDEHQRRVYAAEADGFGLLIGGGDQLYADSLFDDDQRLPLLWRFAHRLSLKDRKLLSLGARWKDEADAVLAGYVRLYCLAWGEGSGISEMLARVPGIFMWDDHEIVDGWGSLELLQECDVYRMLYPEAARAFEAFQLGREGWSGASLPNPIPKGTVAPHYFQTYSFRGTGQDLEVVVLDQRSGRTDTRVLSDAQWSRFEAWRQGDVARGKGTPGVKRHVVVVSPVPMVYRYFTPEMEVFVATGPLRGLGLRDDMLDQWESRLHRPERKRMILELLGHVREARCAVTVLAGDVHIGARGRIISRELAHLPDGESETVIEQLISSGIVHPALEAFEALGMNAAGGTAVDRTLGDHIESRLERTLDGRQILAQRNWLDIEWDRAGASRMLLRWYAEDAKYVKPTVVVTPP